MATIAQLKARREALLAQRASGVARVSYHGRAVDSLCYSIPRRFGLWS